MVYRVFGFNQNYFTHKLLLSRLERFAILLIEFEQSLFSIVKLTHYPIIV